LSQNISRSSPSWAGSSWYTISPAELGGSEMRALSISCSA
jgi:hypothetical protein